MGDVEAGALASVESPLKYHPCWISALTVSRDPGTGQCLVGSFTGEVGSYNATEPRNGWLVPDGNRNDSANA